MSEQINPSPVEVQVALLKELGQDQEAANAFTRDPRKYCADHGIMLSEELLKAVTDALVAEVALHGVSEICGGIATGGGVRALPVIKAATVITGAVVSLKSALVVAELGQRVIDLKSLKGPGDSK